jgi:putative protease
VRRYLPEAKLIADFRFNIGNCGSALFFEKLGFESYVASAELTIPQLRDLNGAKAAIVYGRVPLMLLEKCVIKELYGDKRGCSTCAERLAKMTDRRGFVFPIIRTGDHRNIVFNSMPTYMADRQDQLFGAGIVDRHFIFTVESGVEIDGVIDAYKKNRAANGTVRRI